MTALALLGFALGLLALAFVVWPLARPASAAHRAALAASELAERRRALYQQILDVEMDQRMGKLDEADARELSARLLREAAALLASESADEREIEAEVEREILAVRRALAAARETELGPVKP